MERLVRLEVWPKEAATSNLWADQIYAHPLIAQLEGRTATERSRLSKLPPEGLRQSFG
jgi:hypothetical protein